MCKRARERERESMGVWRLHHHSSFCFVLLVFCWKKPKAEANRPAVSSISRAESAETELIHLPVFELAVESMGERGGGFCRWGISPSPSYFFCLFFSSYPQCLLIYALRRSAFQYWRKRVTLPADSSGVVCLWGWRVFCLVCPIECD